jgi:hypothetical protein
MKFDFGTISDLRSRGTDVLNLFQTPIQYVQYNRSALNFCADFMTHGGFHLGTLEVAGPPGMMLVLFWYFPPVVASM